MDKLQGTKSEDKQNELDMTKVVEALAGIVARERELLCGFIWGLHYRDSEYSLRFRRPQRAFKEVLAAAEMAAEGEVDPDPGTIYVR